MKLSLSEVRNFLFYSYLSVKSYSCNNFKTSTFLNCLNEGNPYPTVDNNHVFDKLKEGYRMPKPDNCSDELYELMRLCWKENPNVRPDFPVIRRKLETMIENSNYVTYLNLVSGNNDESDKDSGHQSMNLSA